MPTINLRGVRVHNLKNIDLALPLNRLIAVTGVSGSGKSSLAFDTLYAEGQRRYIESFSAYTRQFLDRVPHPDADGIDNIPPAIAIRQNARHASTHATVGTTTEIQDYLGLLFAKVGRVVCPKCLSEVSKHTPEDIARVIQAFGENTRFLITFPMQWRSVSEWNMSSESLRKAGFQRVILHDTTQTLRDSQPSEAGSGCVVVDRLVAGRASEERLRDSLESAYQFGYGRCVIWQSAESFEPTALADDGTTTIDDKSWIAHHFSHRLVCDKCEREFADPEPPLFNSSSALGACPTCHGTGSVPSISFDKVVPDPRKTLREGAIVPWTTPAYAHELDELLALADDYDIPVDIPFNDLEQRHLELIEQGVPERQFGGLRGFFDWLERHKYRLPVRVFRNRWRGYAECEACHGDQLQPMALAVRIGGLNIAECLRLSAVDAAAFVESCLERLSESERHVVRIIKQELVSRLQYLIDVGVGYLTLNRRLKTLSSGEAQRVAMTAVLGSRLVDTLYVLDEPSAGLHPRDNSRVVESIQRIRDAGNTVVVVEHDHDFIRVADEVVDIGPGAGQSGGYVVVQGTPSVVARTDESITGQFLSNKRRIPLPEATQRRSTSGSVIQLSGVTHHNLKNVTVDFPLGLLCVVSGVSGSGKSSLVEDALYSALCRQLEQPCSITYQTEHGLVRDAGSIDAVVLVDQAAIGRTSRSNLATYMKVFSEIRKTFGQTADAKALGLTAKDFSFNSAAGGRCPKCSGNGCITLDMQFLADMSMTCPECHGSRFRDEILKAKYRGRTIADVLAMTVEEALGFFRRQLKIVKVLTVLKNVGLSYLPLGQPAPTLSGGESQRLKLASFLASSTRLRTLFLLNEPTIGLHPADVQTLLACLNDLISVGHSVVVIEHNIDVVKSADYVIDLGPEAGERGGQVVASGTPEVVRATAGSATGQFLSQAGVPATVAR